MIMVVLIIILHYSFYSSYIYNNNKIHPIMDNQFINATLLVHRQAPQLDPKTELIKKLQLKNSKLKAELIKIQRTVEQRFGDGQQQSGPKKRESLFQSEDNFQVLTKELANTYKRIKMYQYQINKLEEANRNTNISQKVTQIEEIIKQRKTMNEKIKQQFLKQQKIVQENMKKLENNSQKEELEVYMRKLTDQAKYFKEKIKLFEKKDSLKSGNMKKQYQAIKKQENQLLQSGFASGELQQIKQKAIKSLKSNKKQMDQTVRDQLHAELSEQEIEDKTKQHYQSLLNDISLLQKMHNDHEKQLVASEQDKQDAIRKNLNSRNKLLECENEIQNLEKEIIIIKNKVLPSNLKPLNPIRSYSSHHTENTMKILPSKSTLIAKNKSLNHLLKFDEIGMPSAKGQRFTDRILLGKSNLNSKITGIKVYFDKSNTLIAGIQMTYTGNKKGGDYVKKDKDNKEKQYNEEQFMGKGSNFVRCIFGTLTSDNKLQSLKFSFSDGSSQKFGNAKTVEKSFTMNIASQEYPVCIFGSLLVSKQAGKKEQSLIQHLGFQLQNDEYNSRSMVINQFDD